MREEAQKTRAKQLEERTTHELAYGHYRSEAIDAYLAANFSEEAYRALIERKRQELAPRYKRMTAWKPEVLLQFLKAAVRADIERRLSFIPFDTFCEHQRKRLEVERNPIEVQDIVTDGLRSARMEQAETLTGKQSH